MSESTDAAPAAAAAPPSNLLAAARAAAGLSVADVGRQLKLSPWQVEALEAGNYARLPGPVFVRGFIRNYARLVRIDPAPLLAEIAGQAPVVAPVVPAPAADIPFPGQRSFRWRPFAIGGVIIVVGLAAYQLFVDDQPPADADTRVVELPQPKVVVEVTPLIAVEPPPAPVAAPVLPPSATAVPQPTAPALAIKGSPAPAVTMSGTVVPQQTVPVPQVKAPADARAPAAAKVPLDAPPAPAVKTPAEARPARAESAADERVVRLMFTRDSWVEVRDRQGRVIFSQLNPAGTTQTVSGQPPFKLVVGNASGVRMLYKDQAVDLAPHTQVDVARLTLE